MEAGKKTGFVGSTAFVTEMLSMNEFTGRRGGLGGGLGTTFDGSWNDPLR